ncbi:MAG: hypothetical protein ABI740_02135 [Alphaproteobacteria bacterium]
MSDQPLPEQITLRQPSIWTFGMIAGLAVSGFLTVRTIPADMVTPIDGMRVRWGLGILFALFASALLMRQLFGQGFRLILNPHGFMEVGIVGRRQMSWSDCSRFEAVTVGGGNHVIHCVGYTGLYEVDAKMRLNYGEAPEELADLLNRFRDRALAGAGA